MRSLRGLHAIACAVVLLSCAAERTAIEGVVVDALTGAPIANATVRLENTEQVARTGADGRFAFLGNGDRVHVVAAEHLAGSYPIDAVALWPAAPSEEAIDAWFAARAHERDDPDDPALSTRARAYLRGEPSITERDHDHDVGAVRAALEAPPTSIRVWRRSIDGEAESCMGRIDVIEFEDYIRGVLPHEWIASWHDESLRAGALTIRTYAWRWVSRGGKYDCADLDDTARSQVYRDARTDRATQAVDDTRGQAITVDGVLATGEYSAENGDPTALGVEDPLCTGRTIQGHRRGMCQWGSQRWAMDGQPHPWIAAHYFPGSVIESATPAAPAYDASYVAHEAPQRMQPGERAEVWIEFRNDGGRSWDLEGTRLAAADGNGLFDVDNWIGPTRVTPPDATGYATGEVGRFTFSIVAPEVEDGTTLRETFQLVQEDASGALAFGPEVTFEIEVRALRTDEPEGPDRPDGSGGCAASSGRGSPWPWFALGFALFVWRRRSTK